MNVFYEDQSSRSWCQSSGRDQFIPIFKRLYFIDGTDARKSGSVMSLNSATMSFILALMCFWEKCLLSIVLPSELESDQQLSFKTSFAMITWTKKHNQDTIWIYIWLDFFPSIWLCTLQHCESAMKWEPACYCTCSVPVMLSGPHFWVLFVVCQFLTVHDCSEAISLNLQFKLGPLQPDYKSTFCALRSSRQWMADISNHSAVNPSVR